MAASPNTPTARKGPVTSSPSSNGSAKVQQQRKISVSQAQQQRKNSNPQTPPKAVMQQRRKSSGAEDPSPLGNKRKFMAEETAQKEGDVQVKAQGTDISATNADTGMASLSKKPRNEETKTEFTSSPTTHQPSSAQTSQMTTNLLSHVLQSQPSPLPSSPSCPILSSHIDAIAHTMWQVAFNHGGMLQRACQYSAMFSSLKLAALAKLNFLPSWWFFREMVVRDLPALLGGGAWVGATIDDGVMQRTWKEAVRWCAKVRRDEAGMVVEE